ncbi:MAG: MMPL family transporter [Rhodospirillales bacterium]|nr:MAG: MMPL family transporter [Rhodospirillales bacterium]
MLLETKNKGATTDPGAGSSPKARNLDRFAVGLADVVIRRRVWFLLGCLAIAVAAGAGLGKLQVSTNYRVFFSAENPDLMAFEAFEKTFTKNDNFLFVVKPRAGTVTTSATMAVIEEMTREAWRIPFATRVDSLTNHQHSHAVGDELIVEDLIRNAAGLTDRQVAARVAIAVAEPLLRDRLISPDMTTAGVNVTLQYPGEDLSEVAEATAAARNLAARIEQAHPDLKVALTGVSALNNAFAEATIADAVTLFPAMFLVLVLVIWLIVRSVAGTVATLAIITLATVTALGIAGWAGISLSPFSGSAPVVILTLALADSVHILISQIAAMRAGKPKDAAIADALRSNFLAVTVTSGTTIVGFLALNFSDAPPFNDLGNIVAVGIAAAWLFSLTFFPAFLSLVPFTLPPRNGMDVAMRRVLQLAAERVIRHHRPVLLGFAALVAASVALIPTVELNDQWVDYFDKRVEFREDTEFAMDNLTGLYLVELSVPAAGPGAISDPEYLRTLDAFAAFLRAQPEVQHVHAYTDTIRRLNMNMNGDDPAFYAIPDSREAAAQYLLLYELSLPYGLDLNDRVSLDKSGTRLTMTLPEISTEGVLDISRRAEEWMAANGAAFMAPTATGAPILFSHISARNIRDMFSGNLIAILLIAAIMVGALRSLRYGLLSLVPNIVPLVLTFGIWVALVGEIGMAAATVSATSLGIIVDNTVHFLIKYLAARRTRGLEATAAIRHAFETVGPAVLANTMILVLGFGVLAYSTFRVTGQMGTLTALAIAVALFVDFILLPALLLAGQTPKPGDVKNETYQAQAA